MKNKSIIKAVGLASLLVIGIFLAGCDNLFEAEVSTNVETENLLKSGYAGADLMLKGAFQALINVSDDLTIHGSISTDDVDEWNGHSTNADEDMGRFLSYNPEPKLMYFGLQDARGQADRFLNIYLDQFNLSVNYAGGTIPVEKRKNTMIAFAKLVRGWSILYLGFMFDKVNFDQGSFITPSDAINKAIDDFKAIELLYSSGQTDEAYFNGISIREAASTLLSKAYLQIAQYDLAIAAAQKGYTKTTKGTSGSLDGTVNVYFSVAATNITTIDGNLIFTHVGNKATAAKAWAVTSWFLQNDASDQRISLDSTTSTNAKFTTLASNDRALTTNYKPGYTVPRIPKKYMGTTVMEKPIRMLSWQDNVLTWSEALARKGDMSGITKANEVRVGLNNDAGTLLASLTTSSSQDALNVILNERRIEFYVEMADRFISLRRFGIKQEVSGVEYMFPVPSSE